jgi:hypothetical protein
MRGASAEQRPVIIIGALCQRRFVNRRFVLSRRFAPGAFHRGALCHVALCTVWRFVPRGAPRAALSGPPYVALSRQKAPHTARCLSALVLCRYHVHRHRLPRFLLQTWAGFM